MKIEKRHLRWLPLILFIIFCLWLVRQNPDSLIPCAWYMPDPEKNCVDGRH